MSAVSQTPVNAGPQTLAPSLLPPSCRLHRNPGRGESAQGMCGMCALCDNMCVLCVCCSRVSVDTTNSMAQTSRPTADPRPSSSPKVDLNQVQPLASCFSHPSAQGLISRLGLCSLLLGRGSVWPKQQASWRLLELVQATPAEEPQPCLCQECQG